MRRNSLQFLRCPQCFSPLQMNILKANDSIVYEGQLTCSNNHSFQIRNRIPRFVLPEYLDKRQRQTMEIFSTQWNRFGQVTIDEKAFKISQEWLFNRYGWKDIEGVRQYLQSKKIILDAGSASGRYANLFANLSSESIVFGAEISEGGLEVATNNFADTPNLHFVQACIPHLPFPKETFDFIMSDGVLHHTSDPKKSFVELLDYLKPGGEIAIYLYHKGNPLRELTDDYFIEAFSRRDMDKILEINKLITSIAKEIFESGAKVILPKNLKILNAKQGEYSLYDFIYWKIIKLYWDPNVEFDKNWSTNFGWFAPVNAYRYNSDEVVEWFNELSLKILYSDASQRGISIRALKH